MSAPDPMRFLATKQDGTPLIASQDPDEVRTAAEQYATEHQGEFVHLYQHRMSLRSTPDGD